MSWFEEIMAYQPHTEGEASDLALIAQMHDPFGDRLLDRSLLCAHLSSSSIIVNRAGTRTLMAFHNIYQSWAWTGGHCDGSGDLLGTALREAREETGIVQLTPVAKDIISVDVIPVFAHEKRGIAVPAHLHINVTYGLIGDEAEAITACQGENSAVGWLEIAALDESIREPIMRPIYRKIIDRILATDAFKNYRFEPN